MTPTPPPPPPLPDRALLATVRRLLLAHYRRTRRALPWRDGAAARDPYAIWVCEIMAQQTQIDRVVAYWTRWMARFPTVAALAAAPLDEVLALWAGLGYYARARSLHRAAAEVMARFGGHLPAEPEALRTLPGIGPYTAGAIASIAFGRRAAAVDGNVARVLSRVFAVGGEVSSQAGRARMAALAEALLPTRGGAGDFNQALFDLGATVCTPRAPGCERCPLRAPCAAAATGTQERLGRGGPRARAREVVVEHALVTRGEAWLLCRRAPSAGLYGGLWELPEVAALEAAVPGRVALARERALAEHVHHLTHRTRQHRVFAARIGGGGGSGSDLRWPAGGLYDAARWLRPADIGEVGVSSATSALVKALGKRSRRATEPAGEEGASNRPWPTRRKR